MQDGRPELNRLWRAAFDLGGKQNLERTNATGIRARQNGWRPPGTFHYSGLGWAGPPGHDKRSREPAWTRRASWRSCPRDCWGSFLNSL